jgi:hypothetical protein
VTVGQALARLAREPVQLLIRHLNWKAALLSAIVRGAIFFMAALPAGAGAAFLALGLDVPLRLGLAGLYGAIVQGLRRAEPVWAANTAAVLVILVLTHGLEFVVHALGNTPRLSTAIAWSAGYSAVSAVFNLYLMRRGILVVGPDGGTLREDARRLPGVLLDLLRGIGSLARPAGRREDAAQDPGGRRGMERMGWQEDR